MAFDHHHLGDSFIGLKSGIAALQQSLPQHDALMARTHDSDFDTNS